MHTLCKMYLKNTLTHAYSCKYVYEKLTAKLQNSSVHVF